LDDPEILARQGDRLHHLALAGARLRRALDLADLDVLARVADDFRPRALIALGTEARLVRAVAEPTCPLPLVAWPRYDLPAWLGPLDLVVVVAGDLNQVSPTVREALRRGAVVFVVGSQLGALPEFAVGRSLAQVVTGTADSLVNAAIALCGLERLGLTPASQPHVVADTLDEVAERCSPHRPLGLNPAKEAAVGLADTTPLIWGGTVLAARVSRRLAEAVRAVSHRVALVADAAELLPVLAGATPHDPFADPFLRPTTTPTYCLVTLDDATGDPAVGQTRRDLERLAEVRGVRVIPLTYGEGSPFQRYACLLQQGLFAAAFLDLGLSPDPAMAGVAQRPLPMDLG
jgi:hypothetical protein